MNIQLCVKELRNAANALEKLLQMNETGVNAAAILGSPKIGRPKGSKNKKINFWKTPEGRRKMSKMVKARWAKKNKENK